MIRALLEALGVDEASVAEARAALGRRMRIEGEAFIDEAAQRTMSLAGYEQLDLAEVRPNTARSMSKILEALEGGDMTLFGELVEDVAYRRARQGLPAGSLYGLADITEELLNELAGRCLDDPRALMSAAVVARGIADGARAVILESFQRAHVEVRTEVEHLASQFSAPLLPALPGVLVLPIIGAVSRARAEQILDAVLEGVGSHAAHTVILDITGIAEVDGSLPRHLGRTAQAAGLLGARVILVGVGASIAELLVGESEALAGVGVHQTLASALLALSRVRAGDRS